MLREGPPPRSGGRPPVTTHSELERAAFVLFDEVGFDETTVDDIAADVGISRRTFFRYYPSKSDLVWGDFDGELDRLRSDLAGTPDRIRLMPAIGQAVLRFNRVSPAEAPRHRRRLTLILGTPSLLANSTLRFAQWRGVIADFAAARMGGVGQSAEDLVPSVIGHAALGTAIAAYEHWIRDDSAELEAVLGEAFARLSAGFSDRRWR